MKYFLFMSDGHWLPVAKSEFERSLSLSKTRNQGYYFYIQSASVGVHAMLGSYKGQKTILRQK